MAKYISEIATAESQQLDDLIKKSILPIFSRLPPPPNYKDYDKSTNDAWEKYMNDLENYVKKNFYKPIKGGMYIDLKKRKVHFSKSIPNPDKTASETLFITRKDENADAAMIAHLNKFGVDDLEELGLTALEAFRIGFRDKLVKYVWISPNHILRYLLGDDATSVHYLFPPY